MLVSQGNLIGLSWRSYGVSDCLSGYTGVNPWAVQARSTSGQDRIWPAPYQPGLTTYTISCLSTTNPPSMLSDSVDTVVEFDPATLSATSTVFELISHPVAKDYDNQAAGTGPSTVYIRYNFRITPIAGSDLVFAGPTAYPFSVLVSRVGLPTSWSWSQLPNSSLVFLNPPVGAVPLAGDNWLVRGGTAATVSLLYTFRASPDDPVFVPGSYLFRLNTAQVLLNGTNPFTIDLLPPEAWGA